MYKPTKLDSPSCDKCWQKRYKNGRDTLYFLDIKHYKMTHPTTKEDLSGYEISCQVYLKSDTAINMTFLNDNLEEAEYTINKMFEVGLLKPYEEVY